MKLTGEPLKITHVAKKMLMIAFKLSLPKRLTMIIYVTLEVVIYFSLTHARRNEIL